MSKLKASFYNLYFDVNNQHFIYNTLSTSIVGLDDDSYNILKNNTIENLNKEYIDPLYEQGFLVEEDTDEPLKYLYFYNRTRLGGGAKLLSITLMPTYQCNLACPYCLEGQGKPSEMITSEQVNAILTFAENEIIASKEHGVPISEMHARLYGGEPMLHKKAIIHFMEGMNQIAQNYNCKISNYITTNFTLLDQQMIDFIRKFNIHVQVTIDGTQEEHDARRVTKDGNGTYNIIVQNLEFMQKAGLSDNLSIRINIDQGNLPYAEEMLKTVGKYSQDTYFGLLEKYNGFNDDFSNEFVSNELDDREKTVIGLNDILRKHGYTVPEEFGKLAPCAINAENKWHIDCYLNVYKCELAVNQPKLKAGVLTLSGNFIPNANFYKQLNHSPEHFDECMTCKRLPLCASGCATKGYIARNQNDGNLDVNYCLCSEKGLIDYLKDYVLRLQQDVE